MSYKKEGWNWRNLYLPTLKAVPATYAQLLAKPVEVVISCNGAIREVAVSRDDQKWSINFKKALVVLFQAKIDSYSIELEENRIQHHSNQGRAMWTVREESLQGRCEATYQVNEIPEYIIREQPELAPMPELCPSAQAGRKYFEITRTRNLLSCDRRAQFNFFKPGRMNPWTMEETHGSVLPSLTSVTKYVVCGETTFQSGSGSSSGASGMAKILRIRNMALQRIYNENEQNVNLMGFQTEKFVTGSKQKLILRRVAAATIIPTVAQPMKLHTLMYEHEANTLWQQGSGSGSGNGMVASGQANGAAQKEVMKKLFREVVAEIVQSEQSGITEEKNKSNINLKVLSLARGFAMHKTAQEIVQLFQEVTALFADQHQREVATNFFVDTLGMAGTPASVEVIAKLIQENKMTQVQIANFFMWMPHYIVYPTTQALEKLYQVIRSDKIQQAAMPVRNVAIASFTQLLQQACFSEDRKVAYPTFVTGEFCHPNSNVVKMQWMPYLIGQLSSARDVNERNIFLVALGTLQHKDIVRELIPYVSGALTHQVGQKVTTLNRLMATYSLANIGHLQPNAVVPTLLNVFSNPSEAAEIRIAAFNCLLRMNPTTAAFQRIAAVTQQDPTMSYEILKTVNIALYTLGHQDLNEKLGPADIELINKARVTYRLIKRVNGIVPTSGTFYTSDYLRQLGVGYEAFIAYVANEASILPKSMYAEVKYVLDQVSVSPLRLGYRLGGARDLVKNLGEVLLKGMKGESAGQANINKLDAAVIAQIYESGALFLSAEQLSTESLSKMIMPYLKNPALLKQKLGGLTQLNIQRAINLCQMNIIVPSDMGLPITMEYHSPLTISAIGNVNAQTVAAKPKVAIEGKLLLTTQTIAYIGTIVPFSTNSLLLTGVNQHAVINVPGVVELEMDAAAQKVAVMVKPHSKSATPVSMLHLHTYPFTVAQNRFDLTPVCEQANLKFIQSPQKLATREAQFGDYLGLALKAKIETESRFTDLASVFDTLKVYKNSPMNVLAFPWTLSALSEKLIPSVRRQRVSVVYDPTQSSTKAIGFEIRVGVATKKSGEASGKYHALKVKSASSGAVGGSSSGSGSIAGKYADLIKMAAPYEVSEKVCGAAPMHPRREQKLKEMLGEMESSVNAAGVALHMTAIVKGSRARTWTSTLAIIGGVKNQQLGSIQQLWNIRLEKAAGSDNSPKHLCAKGSMKLPILPIWNNGQIAVNPIDFAFENTISMGMAACGEAKIVTAGNARVSEEQMEYSKKSMEAKKCKAVMASAEGGKVTSAQGGKMEAKYHHACKAAIQQATTLDIIELKNQFVKVPEIVKQAEQTLATIAKAYLWPFARTMLAKPFNAAENTFSTTMKIAFKKAPLTHKAFDLFVERPQERLVFINVRIPSPLNFIAPLKAGPYQVNRSSMK
jgi:hypothetical protein